MEQSNIHILMKVTAHQTYAVIMNVCVSNNRVLKYMRKKPAMNAGHTENSTNTEFD